MNFFASLFEYAMSWLYHHYVEALMQGFLRFLEVILGFRLNFVSLIEWEKRKICRFFNVF